MATDPDLPPPEKILVHVDPEIADLVPGFLDNRRKDVTAMLDALDKNDFEAIRILGHSMKGVGGGYGFDAITEIGAALEQAAKNTNPEDVRKGLRDLTAYLERVEAITD